MNLYCERYPNLANRDVLFIHGNLASSRWWHPLLEEWRTKGSTGRHSLLMADWRGCGHNEDWPQSEAFDLTDLAHDYLELIEKERLQSVTVVGHSLGGLIAQQMMIEQPQKIDKAVLLDSVGPKGVVFDDSMYEAFRQMALSPDLTRTVILSTVLNSERLPSRLKDQIAEDGYKAVRGIGSSVLQILRSVDICDRIAQVKIPTLILHGAKDQIIPVADSELLARLMPNSTLEVLADAGHCLNVENPRELVRRLRSWI